jgi:acyl carrier protein
MTTNELAFQKIKERCCIIFKIPPDEITEATQFEADLNAKSVNITMMLNYLEDEFGVEIPFMTFRRYKTLGEAAEYISTLLND